MKDIKTINSTISRFLQITILCIILLSGLSVMGQKRERLTEYVNPFIGTGGHGHTFPGATVPFGMVQLSPDQNIVTNLATWDYCSGYHFPDTKILGFSHTHLSGTGDSDMLDIRIQPTAQDSIVIDTTQNGKHTGLQFADDIKPLSEIAQPGYYSVTLAKSNIKTELTVSKRAGFSKFIFPNGKQNLLLDLSYFGGIPTGTMIHVENDTLVTGYSFTSRWAKNQKVYFAIRLSKPITSYQYSRKGIPLAQTTDRIKGDYLLALLRFKTDDNLLMTKVGISSVSIEGALKNVDTEIPNWDFNEIRLLADKAWEKELSHIQIESRDQSKKQIFYTAYYHNMIAPTVYSDVDGQFRGDDDAIYKVNGFNFYTVFSLWDTYRATHPFYTIVAPDRVSEFVQTMLLQYQISGMLPIWTLAGEETWGMHGNHSIPVIADAYFKGIKNIDLSLALKATKASLAFDHKGMAYYDKLGYVPIDKQPEAGGISMEYYYDDWCAAQLAKAAGNNSDYEYFLNRSSKYHLQYNSKYGLMQPKKLNHEFMEPFESIGMGGKYGFTEGNAWQYTFSLQHDINGMAKLFGGNKQLENKLDALFSLQNTTNPGEVLDVTGIIGLYAHGNEPCHHIPYLYNYSGNAWKTQKLVKLICDSLYTNKRDGICGNDDCGQMSAWYLFSSMGLYPVNPANGVYDIGTPAFDKLTINLDNGKVFKIIAKELSNKKFYVQKVILNGIELSKPFIKHSDIMNGGELVFIMSDKANKNLWIDNKSKQKN